MSDKVNIPIRLAVCSKDTIGFKVDGVHHEYLEVVRDTDENSPARARCVAYMISPQQASFMALACLHFALSQREYATWPLRDIAASLADHLKISCMLPIPEPDQEPEELPTFDHVAVS